MPYNVYTPSITYLLQRVAQDTLTHNGIYARSTPKSDKPKFYNLGTFLVAALGRPLAAELSNQQTPDQLVPIEIDPKAPPAWAERALAAGETIYEFDPSDQTFEAIYTIADWIFATIARSDPWLARTDNQGRPLKLIKFGSLKQALAEAQKMTPRSIPAQTDTSADTKTVMKFPDGSRIVELLSTASLRDEGEALGHCMALGRQDAKLTQGTHAYYSLRDLYGNPHVTMEVLRGRTQNTLIQVRGKQNALPTNKYMPFILAFATERTFKLVDRIAMTGIIQQRGVYYDVRQLPKGFRYLKALDLTEMPDCTLPDGLTIEGNLFLGQSDITRLPANLTVTGSVSMWGSAIESIGANLTVADTFMAHEARLTTLPRGTRIGDFANFARSQITTLPDDLYIGGTLDLEATPITHIPATIYVGEEINIQNTPLASVPALSP